MVGFKSIGICSLVATLAIASPFESEHLVKKQSGVPVGQLLYGCTVPGTIAITFDDGPAEFTNKLLDTLAETDMKATFFVNGVNYGDIFQYADVIQRMVDDGHQVASHTWSHANLATLDATGVTLEMTQLEDALMSIIGKFPTYMRPPYFSTNPESAKILGDLGYHVMIADIDTKDFENTSDLAASVQNFISGIKAGGSISLEHDPVMETVYALVPRLIDVVRSTGLRAVTVGECLGDSPANWYRTGR